MSENEFWAFLWKMVIGLVAVIAVMTGVYNVHKDYQRALAFGKSASAPDINCAFDGNPVVCALLVQQPEK